MRMFECVCVCVRARVYVRACLSAPARVRVCVYGCAYVITHAQNCDIIWVILKKQVAILEKNRLPACLSACVRMFECVCARARCVCVCVCVHI